MSLIAPEAAAAEAEAEAGASAEAEAEAEAGLTVAEDVAAGELEDAPALSIMPWCEAALGDAMAASEEASGGRAILSE